MFLSCVYLALAPAVAAAVKVGSRHHWDVAIQQGIQESVSLCPGRQRGWGLQVFALELNLLSMQALALNWVPDALRRMASALASAPRQKVSNWWVREKGVDLVSGMLRTETRSASPKRVCKTGLKQGKGSRLNFQVTNATKEPSCLAPPPIDGMNIRDHPKLLSACPTEATHPLLLASPDQQTSMFGPQPKSLVADGPTSCPKYNPSHCHKSNL